MSLTQQLLGTPPPQYVHLTGIRLALSRRLAELEAPGPGGHTPACDLTRASEVRAMALALTGRAL